MTGQSGAPVTLQTSTPSENERTWALAAHLGALVIGFLAPLIVMLTQGKESSFVRNNAVESLNFQITVALASLVAGSATIILIGFLLLPAVLIGALVFTVIGGIKAYQGEVYRFPVTLRFIK